MQEMIYPVTDQLARAQLYVKRRQNLGRVQTVVDEILSGIDSEAFEQRFAQYRQNHVKYSKYLQTKHWLLETVSRYFLYDMHRIAASSQVLDLGCGAGYFLLVCRHFGHDGLGLDVTDHAIFDELIDFFQIDRINFRIEPGVALPDFGRRFDVVTAFMTCFNRYPDGTPWGATEWVDFLTDLRQHVADTGQVIIKFNCSRFTNEFYPRQVRRAVRSMPEYSAHFFRDSLRLTAQPAR